MARTIFSAGLEFSSCYDVRSTSSWISTELLYHEAIKIMLCCQIEKNCVVSKDADEPGYLSPKAV